jgi:O-antigen/teichoic acid export membrane protein
MPARRCSDLQNKSGFCVQQTVARQRSLKTNFSWTLFGNLIYGSNQWMMVISLARLGSPKHVGEFTLALAVCSPIYMLSNLHLREVLAVDSRRDFAFGHYLALRLIATFAGLLGIVGIAISGRYSIDAALIIVTVGLARGLDNIGDVFYGLAQQHERMDRVAKSMLIRGPLCVGALCVTFWLTRNIAASAIAMAAASALVLIAYDARVGSWLSQVTVHATNAAAMSEDLIGHRPCWDRSRLVQLARLAFPLAIVMMLVSLTTNIPRYFIERYLGPRQLGIFSALSMLMMAAYMVVSALAQSASARLGRYMAEGELDEFRRLLSKLVGTAIVLGAVGVVLALTIGSELLRLIYGPEYAAHSTVFVWLMCAAGIWYVGAVLGFALIAARLFWSQLPLFACSATACAFASLTLIPSRGLRGAAMAVLIAISVQTLGATFILLKTFPVFSLATPFARVRS